MGVFFPTAIISMGHPYCPQTVFGLGATIPPTLSPVSSDSIDTPHAVYRNLKEDLDPQSHRPDPLGHEHPQNRVSNLSIKPSEYYDRMEGLRRSLGWVLGGSSDNEPSRETIRR